MAIFKPSKGRDAFREPHGWFGVFKNSHSQVVIRLIIKQNQIDETTLYGTVM